MGCSVKKPRSVRRGILGRGRTTTWRRAFSWSTRKRPHTPRKKLRAMSRFVGHLSRRTVRNVSQRCLLNWTRSGLYFPRVHCMRPKGNWRITALSKDEETSGNGSGFTNRLCLSSSSSYSLTEWDALSSSSRIVSPRPPENGKPEVEGKTDSTVKVTPKKDTFQRTVNDELSVTQLRENPEVNVENGMTFKMNRKKCAPRVPSVNERSVNQLRGEPEVEPKTVKLDSLKCARLKDSISPLQVTQSSGKPEVIVKTGMTFKMKRKKYAPRIPNVNERLVNQLRRETEIGPGTVNLDCVKCERSKDSLSKLPIAQSNEKPEVQVEAEMTVKTGPIKYAPRKVDVDERLVSETPEVELETEPIIIQGVKCARWKDSISHHPKTQSNEKPEVNAETKISGEVDSKKCTTEKPEGGAETVPTVEVDTRENAPQRAGMSGQLLTSVSENPEVEAEARFPVKLDPRKYASRKAGTNNLSESQLIEKSETEFAIKMDRKKNTCLEHRSISELSVTRLDGQPEIASESNSSFDLDPKKYSASKVNISDPSVTHIDGDDCCIVFEKSVSSNEISSADLIERALAKERRIFQESNSLGIPIFGLTPCPLMTKIWKNFTARVDNTPVQNPDCSVNEVSLQEVMSKGDTEQTEEETLDLLDSPTITKSDSDVREEIKPMFHEETTQASSVSVVTSSSFNSSDEDSDLSPVERELSGSCTPEKTREIRYLDRSTFKGDSERHLHAKCIDTVPTREDIAAKGIDKVLSKKDIAAKGIDKVLSKKDIAAKGIDIVSTKGNIAAKAIDTVPTKGDIAAKAIDTVPTKEDIATKAIDTVHTKEDTDTKGIDIVSTKEDTAAEGIDYAVPTKEDTVLENIEMRKKREVFLREDTAKHVIEQDTTQVVGDKVLVVTNVDINQPKIPIPVGENPCPVMFGGVAETSTTSRGGRQRRCRCRTTNFKLRRLNKRVVYLKKRMLLRTRNFQADRDVYAELLKDHTKVMKSFLRVLRSQALVNKRLLEERREVPTEVSRIVTEKQSSSTQTEPVLEVEESANSQGGSAGPGSDSDVASRASSASRRLFVEDVKVDKSAKRRTKRPLSLSHPCSSVIPIGWGSIRQKAVELGLQKGFSSTEEMRETHDASPEIFTRTSDDSLNSIADVSLQNKVGNSFEEEAITALGLQAVYEEVKADEEELVEDEKKVPPKRRKKIRFQLDGNEMGASQDEIIENNIGASQLGRPENEVRTSQPERPENEIRACQLERPENEIRACQPERPENEIRACQPERPENEIGASQHERTENEIGASQHERPENEIGASQTERPENAIRACQNKKINGGPSPLKYDKPNRGSVKSKVQKMPLSPDDDSWNDYIKDLVGRLTQDYSAKESHSVEGNSKKNTFYAEFQNEDILSYLFLDEQFVFTTRKIDPAFKKVSHDDAALARIVSELRASGNIDAAERAVHAAGILDCANFDNIRKQLQQYLKVFAPPLCFYFQVHLDIQTGDEEFRVIVTEARCRDDWIERLEGYKVFVKSSLVGSLPRFVADDLKEEEDKIAVVVGPASFINQDSSPNVKFVSLDQHAVGVVAIRDILPGEELLTAHALGFSCKKRKVNHLRKVKEKARYDRSF